MEKEIGEKIEKRILEVMKELNIETFSLDYVAPCGDNVGVGNCIRWRKNQFVHLYKGALLTIEELNSLIAGGPIRERVKAID